MASSKSHSKYKDSREKKSDTAVKDSTSMSSGSSNAFANDGSFFEMFQRKMKEMEQTKAVEQCDQKHQMDKSEKVGEVDEKRTDQVKQETGEDTKLGSSSLLSQGKRKVVTGRMGGAAKQLTVKKKKEEKEKESTEPEEGGEKSSAWKAYLDEVKKYREMSCTDDVDRVRPLVK